MNRVYRKFGNGGFGTNPTPDMMRETALVLGELVDTWRQISEGAG